MNIGSGIKERINKILKQKNIKSLILTLLVVVIFYLCLSYFLDVNNISNSEETNKNNTSITKYGLEGIDDISAYEEKQQKDLKNLLEKIDGIGKVEVKINYESSEIKVPAVDSNTKKNTTEETDNEGGIRNNIENSSNDAVVMTNKNEPLVLQTNKPNITGIIIVAEGSSDSKVKYNIQKAVASLYDIGMDKVNVLTMKENSKN